MTNYQLYRTNHLLSGQVKWDMVIKDEVDKLSVGEFHLSPISPNIPYNLDLDEKLLNNDHSENLRLYYEKNKGIFFNDGVESQFKNNWPSTSKVINYSDNEVFNNIIKEFYIEELKDDNGNKILDTDKNPLFGQLENIELIRNYKYAGYEMRFVMQRELKEDLKDRGLKYWTCNFLNIKYNDTYFNNKENSICIGELKWRQDILGNSHTEGTSVCKIYAIIDWSQCTYNTTGQGDWARYKSTGRIKLNKNSTRTPGNIPATNTEDVNKFIKRLWIIPTSESSKTIINGINEAEFFKNCINGVGYQINFINNTTYYYDVSLYTNIDGDVKHGQDLANYVNTNYKGKLGNRIMWGKCDYFYVIAELYWDANISWIDKTSVTSGQEAGGWYKRLDFKLNHNNTTVYKEDFTDPQSNIPCISIDNSPYIKSYIQNTSFNYEKNYVDDYQMGAKRAKYKLFNKQFQFFCPVWLEEVKNNIKFKLSLWSDAEGREIASNQLLIERNGDDKFSKYLFKYIDELKLNIGNDDLININLDSGVSSLTGVDLVTGTLKTLEDNTIVKNLKYRERPLMESDNIILRNYNKRNLISPQLFNFNIYFNISDIINTIPTKQFENSKLWFKLFVYVDEKKLECVDFYNNYEYIEEKLHCDNIIKEPFRSGFEDKDIISREYSGDNILRFLKDNNCIDLINKNKYLPSIFHWSLVGNNDYLFNLYEGFGCVNYKEKLEDDKFSQTDKIKVPHLYGRGLGLDNIKEYNEYYNTNSWCNIVEMKLKELMKISDAWGSTNHWSEWIGDYANVFYNIVKNGISFDFGDQWYNDNHYISYNKPFEFLDGTYVFPDKKVVNVFIYISEWDGDDWSGLTKEGEQLHGKGYTICLNQYYLYKEINNIIYKFYIANNMNEFNFNNFLINHLQTYQSRAKEYGYAKYSNSNYLTSMKLKTILEGLQRPKLVKFDKSLICNRASSPSQKTDEISYYKLDHCDPYSKYVVRYDGKIKPTFIKRNDYRKNYIYYKKSLSEMENEVNNYKQSKLEPLYPSINYFSIGKVSDTYDMDSKIYNIKDIFEYSHYNESHLYQLPTFIEIPLLYSDNKLYLNREEINNKIKENLDSISYEAWMNNLYDTDIYYILDREDKQYKYKYNIKLTLK